MRTVELPLEALKRALYQVTSRPKGLSTLVIAARSMCLFSTVGALLKLGSALLMLPSATPTTTCWLKRLPVSTSGLSPPAKEIG